MRDPSFTPLSFEEPQNIFIFHYKANLNLTFFKEMKLPCTLKMHCMIVMIDI